MESKLHVCGLPVPVIFLSKDNIPKTNMKYFKAFMGKMKEMEEWMNE